MNFDQINVKTNVNAVQAMGKVIGMILWVAAFVGAGLLIWGVIEIVMSFTNEQPEKKVKGISLALGGILMIGLKAVLTELGVV